MVVAVAVAVRVATAEGAAGKVVVFNDNGAWCWYQDPRVVHDPANDTLLIASVACSDGAGGKSRGGDVDLVSYKLATGEGNRFVLHHNLQPQDDHNTAAILIRPDGKYLAMYSRHNQDGFTYWRVSASPHDASNWGEEQTFDWTPYFKEVDPKNHVTYSNLFFLSAENRTYDFSRAVNTDPTILVSGDQGDTWSLGGKLLTEGRKGYVNGYTKYASNGIDRIDFITTDHHPRDYNNSIYHGYVRGGKLCRTDGTVVDENVLDKDGQPQGKLTKVLAASSVFGSDVMTHAWTVSLKLDRQGQPFGLITARANDVPENSNFSDHRLLYVRIDGGEWRVSQVAKLGPPLFPSEQDYSGLGDVDAFDPNVVYVSTPIDPRDGKALKVHEIFKGTTADAGKTWAWAAVTADSAVDNLRPVVCSWGDGKRAVLWFRGEMRRSQHYKCEVVGFVDGKL
jgi:hypothetical protein